jgi:hypothetical protein
MQSKVGFLGNELNKEQGAQNERLNSALERRRKKKAAMQGAVQKLHQKKNKEKDRYEANLKDNAGQEQLELQQLEEEI